MSEHGITDRAREELERLRRELKKDVEEMKREIPEDLAELKDDVSESARKLIDEAKSGNTHSIAMIAVIVLFSLVGLAIFWSLFVAN